MHHTRSSLCFLSVILCLNGCQSQPQPGLIGTWTQSSIGRLKDSNSPAKSPTFQVKAIELLISPERHATLQQVRIDGSDESTVTTTQLQWFGEPHAALTLTDHNNVALWKATLITDTTMEFERVDRSAEVLLLLKEAPALFPDDTGHRPSSPATHFIAKIP